MYNMICILLLIFSNAFNLSCCDFTQSELNLSVSLIKHFNLKECVLSTDLITLNVYTVAKKLTLSNGFYTFFTPSSNLIDLILHHEWVEKDDTMLKRILKGYFHPRQSVIIWKTNLLFLTEGIKEIMDKKEMKIVHWIIFLTANNVTSEELSQLRAPHNCIFIVVLKSGEEDYKLIEIYQIHYKSKTYVNHFGLWNPDEGLNVDPRNIFRRRSNLENENLKFYIFGNIYFRRSPELSSVYEFWCDMGKILNFSHTVVTKSEITAEEDRLTDIKFHGLLSLYAMDSGTWDHDAIGPLWPSGFYMYVKYERDKLSGLQILSRPFSGQVWTSIGLCFFLSTLLTVIGEYVSFKYLLLTKIKSFSVLESVFASIHTVLNHGRSNLFSNPSNRLLYLLQWIEVVILLPVFTGAVVSLLATTIPNLPFLNLDDFVKKGTYKLNAMEGTYAINYFELHRDNPKLKFIYDNFFVEKSEFIKEIISIGDVICSDPHMVFLGLETWLRYFGNCKVLKMPQPVCELNLVMYLGKRTYLSKIFNYNLLQFRSSGILHKMRKSILKEVDSQGFGPDKVKAIEIKHCLPAFYLILIGVTFSIVLFIGEFLNRKNKKTSTRIENQWCDMNDWKGLRQRPKTTWFFANQRRYAGTSVRWSAPGSTMLRKKNITDA